MTVELKYNPTSLVTYTDTDDGQYNLNNGDPAEFVGLSYSVPITDLETEAVEVNMTLPFIQGSQNNSSMRFEVWANKGEGDEQLMAAGTFTIGNNEKSLQTFTSIPKSSFASNGNKLLALYLGATLDKGNVQVTNNFDSQAAVFRVNHFRDTLPPAP